MARSEYPTDPTVRFDLPAMTPPCFEIASNDQLGKRMARGWKFNLDEIYLFQTKKQKDYKGVTGDYIKTQLKDKTVAGAQLLDFLLKHSELIPDNWKTKTIFFWGTIYREFLGVRCVRCLCWNGSSWFWNYRWLVNSFGKADYILVINKS